MTEVEEILGELNAAGINIWVDDENLRFESPRPLTKEMTLKLRVNKSKLIAHLNAHDDTEDLSKLSYAQERLWFLHELVGQPAVYTIAFALQMRGKLEVAYLKESIRCIWERHDVLHSRYPKNDQGQPQVIHDITFEEIWNYKKLDDFQAVIENINVLVDRGMDIQHGGSSRVYLFESGSRWVLLFLFDHMVFDGWSTHLLIRELSENYNSMVAGEQPHRRSLTTNYRDYALSQRRLEGSLGFRKQLKYWEKQLINVPRLNLNRKNIELENRKLLGKRIEFDIDAKAVQRIQSIVQQNHATLFMGFLSIWKMLLTYYSGQSDFAIGVPVANRTSSELEPIIGLFVNTLCIRSKSSISDSYIECLNGIRDRTLEAYENSEVPFDLVVSELNPERSGQQPPFFQVMFSLESKEDFSLRLNNYMVTDIM